jgi:hypothetical protein
MVHFALIQLTKKHTEIFGTFLEIILNNNWDLTIYYNLQADEYSFLPYYMNLFDRKFEIKQPNQLIDDKDRFDYFIFTSSSDENYIPELFKSNEYADRSIFVQHQAAHMKNYMYKNIVVSPVIKLKNMNTYILPIYKNYKKMHYQVAENQPIVFGIIGGIRTLKNGKTLDRNLDLIKATIDKFPNENYEFQFFMRKWDWMWISKKYPFLVKNKKIKAFFGLKTNDLIEKLRSVKFILPIGKKGGWFYWQRLTGSIPLAINLNIPLIIDEKLAKIYGLEQSSILYKENLQEIFESVLKMDDSIYYDYILKSVRYKREICKNNERNFRDICMVEPRFIRND